MLEHIGSTFLWTHQLVLLCNGGANSSTAFLVATTAAALLTQAIVCCAFTRREQRVYRTKTSDSNPRKLQDVLSAALCDSRGRRSVLSYRCLTATDDAYLRSCYPTRVLRPAGAVLITWITHEP